MILDGFALRVPRERPETVEVDFFTEASGHGVHEKAGGGTLDLDVVGQPVP